MILKQVSVLIENKKGSLAEITALLKDNDINIRAIAAFDTPGYGILRMIVDLPEKAKDILDQNDYGATLIDVIAVELEDQKGALHEVLSILEKEDLQVEYIYSFVIRKKASPLMIIKVNDLEQAIKILIGKDIKIAYKNDIYL